MNARRSGAAVLVVLALFASSLPVLADGEAPEEIGKFTRLGMTGTLTADDVSETSDGLVVEAPALASNLKVEKAWLDETLGEWSSNVPFEVDSSGRVVVDGEDTEFAELVVGEEPVFTAGSKDSIEFAERPMWLSATPQDVGVRLDFDDGDTSGQTVYVAKKWLWEYGIHAPKATHEDGTVLQTTRAADGQGWYIDVPHFSFTILTPLDIDVRMQVADGVPATHAGEVRWDSTSQRLEIDVGAHPLTTNKLWVEMDWMELNLPHPALLDRSWTIDSYGEKPYYMTVLAPHESTLTLTFKEFGIPVQNGYTNGNAASLAFRGEPRFVTSAMNSGVLSIQTAIVGDPQTRLGATANLSWLETLGISKPIVRETGGPTMPRSFAGGLVYYQPTGDDEIQQDVSGMIGDILEDAELCSDYFAQSVEPEYLTTLTGVGGSETTSWARVYISYTTFCWDWHIDGSADIPTPEVFGTWMQVLDENNVGCQQGNPWDGALSDGYAVCDWPTEVALSSYLHVFFAGNAADVESDTTLSAQSHWDDCVGGVSGSLPFGLSVDLGDPADCFAIPFDVFEHERDNLIHTTRVFAGQWITLPEITEATLEIQDPGADRADTWNFVEENLDIRPESYDGEQTVVWSITSTGDAWFKYYPDVSALTLTEPTHDDQLINAFVHDSGYVHAKARVTNLDHEAVAMREAYAGGTGEPGIDWEAPESLCVPEITINALVGGVWESLGLLSEPPTVEACYLVDSAAENSEPWLPFRAGNWTLDTEQINQGPLWISKQDVIDADGRIALAMARKVTENVEFHVGIQNVTVPDLAGVSETCGVAEDPYSGTFKATGGGKAIVGGGDVPVAAQKTVVICFQKIPNEIVEVSSNNVFPPSWF